MKKLNKAVSEYLVWLIDGYNPKILWNKHHGYVVAIMPVSMFKTEDFEVII